MKSFLQTYGISIFTIIIIGIVVLVANPLGLEVQNNVKEELITFSEVVSDESWDRSGYSFKYDFYFERTYATDYSNGMRECILFHKNKTADCWLEYNEEFYNKNKAKLDKYFKSTNFKELNENVNIKYNGNKDGTVLNVTYEPSVYTIVETGKKIYFSEDGKTHYADEARTVFLGQMIED